MNKANSEALNAQQALSEAAKSGNKDEVKSLLSKAKKLLEEANNSLLGLTLQSQELQKLRTDIINGNMIAIQLNDFALKEKRTAEDMEEMKLLTKRMAVLLKTAGAELESLNAKYK